MRSVRDAFIFRGQADCEWKLEPTIDREFPGLDASKRDQKLVTLLSGFRSELLGVGPSHEGPSDRLELLARHHGLPTTLLDWTRSPYVAAYFAFEGCSEPTSGKVCVWTFDKRSLVNVPDAENLVVDEYRLLLDNERAIEQRAVAMRVPASPPLDVLLESGLSKFTIPYAERRSALVDLDTMLITARTLFRDRDAAARTTLIRESLTEV